jgi:hypothetical protein
VKDNHPELIPNMGLYYVPGTDPNGKPCVYWSDEALQPAYKATDCAEGRAFLAKLKEVSLSKDMKPTRLEQAKPFDTAQIRDKMQQGELARLKLLKGDEATR